MSIKRTTQILAGLGVDRSTAQTLVTDFLNTGKTTASVDLLEDAITAAADARKDAGSATAAQQFAGARQTFIRMRNRALAMQKSKGAMT